MTIKCEKCGEPGLVDGCCYDCAVLCKICQEEPAHFKTGVCLACSAAGEKEEL